MFAYNKEFHFKPTNHPIKACAEKSAKKFQYPFLNSYTRKPGFIEAISACVDSWKTLKSFLCHVRLGSFLAGKLIEHKTLKFNQQQFDEVVS